MSKTSHIRSPHAAVIIWNYKERLGNYNASDAMAIEEIILTSQTLISASTMKQKSTPAGRFELRLAPKINWVSKITPGSWCAILMSPDTQITQTKSVSSKTIKMLGCIDSVRVAIDVNQETGARHTEYIVTGTDWGEAFNTKVYIDPIGTNYILDGASTIGHSSTLLADSMIKSFRDKKLLNSSEVTSQLIQIWGSPLSGAIGALESAANLAVNKTNTGSQKMLQLTADNQFLLPKEVSQYMGFTGFLGNAQTKISDILDLKYGKLIKYNTYADTRDGFGFVDPHSLYRINTLWQLLTDNCNTTLNELVTDLGVDDDGNCKLQLFKRIKPFLNRSYFPGITSPQVLLNASYFKNIRTVKINIDDVININAGTNWKDRYNFVEIQPQPQTLPGTTESMIKFSQQLIYKEAYKREGFRPLIESTKYMPFGLDEKPSPIEATQWKYLLAEWYFNTDLMLNGSVSVIGQNQYISVGDNIQIDSKVLGTGFLNQTQATINQTNKSTFLCAHVESVSHTFSVNSDTGSRSFYTTISFVRGIITDGSGTILAPLTLASALSKEADSTNNAAKTNTNVIVSSSNRQ